jgi:hypothetical protein
MVKPVTLRFREQWNIKNRHRQNCKLHDLSAAGAVLIDRLIASIWLSNRGAQ